MRIGFILVSFLMSFCLNSSWWTLRDEKIIKDKSRIRGHQERSYANQVKVCSLRPRYSLDSNREKGSKVKKDQAFKFGEPTPRRVSLKRVRASSTRTSGGKGRQPIAGPIGTLPTAPDRGMNEQVKEGT